MNLKDLRGWMFDRTQLRRLIVPLIIEQFLSAFVGFADTLMVSSAGEQAVSGVSLVDAVNMLVIFVFTALATGGTVTAAQYLGYGDKGKARSAAHQIFMLTLLLSVGIAAILVPLRRGVLGLIYGRVETAVMENATVYFLITGLSYPAIAQFNTCAALLRITGNSKLPMEVAAVMNAVNVAGNALLIYVFRLGAAGAALSTLFARVLGFLILWRLMLRPEGTLSLRGFFPFRFEKKMVKDILRIGIPSGLENGMFQVGKLMVQGIVTGFGTVAIAANAVANSVVSMSTIPGVAIGMALITVVGQCVGASEYRQAKSYMKGMTLLSEGVVTALSLLIILLLKPIMAAFRLTGETMETAELLILLCCGGNILFWSPAFVIPYGLRAASDIKYTMIVAISSMWVMRLGMGYVLSVPLGLGVSGVWIGMLLDWLTRLCLFVWRLHSERWTRHKIPAHASQEAPDD